MAAFSPKYRAQFYGLQPDESIVNVTDASASAFKEFLQFFYLEKVRLTSENIDMVLGLAKQSLVDEFVDECITFLLDSVTMDNLCFSFQVAVLYDIMVLKDLCQLHIISNAKLMFYTKDFIDCDREILIEILKLDSLNCKEIDIFHACISLARASCERNGKNPAKMENLRSELGDAIKHIRFSSISIEDYAVLHKDFSGFFTPEETIDIFYIISKVKGHNSKIFNQKLRNQ